MQNTRIQKHQYTKILKCKEIHWCSHRPFSRWAPLKDLPPSASSAPQTWRLLIEEDGEDGLDGGDVEDGGDGDGDEEDGENGDGDGLDGGNGNGSDGGDVD